VDLLNAITTISEVERIKQNSSHKVQIIFKHSTRRHLSSIAKKRIEDSFEKLSLYSNLYVIDVLKYRSISDFVSSVFDVPHESPQVLILKGEECVLEQSHLEINAPEILEYLAISQSEDLIGNE
jgi:bacillithiol system protein YtxJ